MLELSLAQGRMSVKVYNIEHIMYFCFGNCLCYALTAYLTCCCLSEGSVNALCFQKSAAYSINVTKQNISAFIILLVYKSKEIIRPTEKT